MTKFHMSSSTSPYEMKRKSRRILFKARAVGLLFVVMWASPASPQVTQDCPLGWNSFRESCYNFVFYPHQPYARATSACLYDSAAIISINSDAEHEFISQWLTRHDLDRSHRWWTSGIGDENNLHWEGDGTASAVDMNKKWGEKGVAQLGNQHIVYKFTTSTNTFLWSRQLFKESSPYICETSVREAFRIHQAARDHTFGTDSSNPDEVPRGPRFTISPQSVIVVDGVTTTYLECEAQGVPAPEYSWYKRTEKEQMQITTEMDPRYGLINGKFTFQDPSDSKDAGEYYCKAENPHGAILSNPVRVSFGYLGEFSNDPQGVVAAVLYQGAHMDCSPPRYNPAISVQWYKGPGVNFLRSDLNQHLFLSSNGRLYFSEIQQSDAGMYYCIITLSAPVGQIMATAQPPSKTSLGIELVIRGDIATDFGPSIHNDFPVVFPSPPLHGHHLQIECFAYGSLPLYYSWTRDNGPIPHKVTLLQSGRVLLIPDVQLEDAGNYTCHVQNKLKNVDSKTLSLNVEAAPFFIFPLRDQHVDVGSQVSMRCEAMGIPLPRYSWYKNGQPLAPVPGDIDVQMNTVVITRADSRRHSGMYQCSVANVYGTIFSSAELRIVAFAPSFNKRPLDPSKISTLGGNTTIICQPEAAPMPEITWYHNGMDLGVARGVPGRVMMLDNGNLLITQVQMSDQGEYKCTATNDEGSASSSGLLSVVTHTTISVPPVATRVQVNNTGFLSCEASFDKQHHDLVYAWSFNGHPIDTDNDAHFRKVSVEGLHGIYIVNIQFRHDGEYECQAVTVGDTAKATAYVTVLGPPSEPAGLFGQVNNFSILLEWTQGSSRGSPIVSFTTEYITNLNSEWRVLTSGLQTSEASSTQIPGRYVQTVSDLLPGLLYSFRVRAVNQFGIGDASIPSPFYRIPDASPSQAPDRIVQVISSVGTLAFSWNKLDEEHLTGPGVGYRVFWRKQSSDKDSTWQTDTVQGRDNKYITVVGQDNYYLEYEVKVAAFNAFGQGPNSTQVVIMSAEDIPIATPTNIWGEKYNSTAIMVYWDPVVNTRQYMKGKLWGYQINYWGVEEYGAVGGITIYCDDCEGGMVIGLLPYHYYWVNVQTFNSAGYGPQGEKYLVGTFHFSPLLYPEYVTVTSHGASSVYVAWRGVFTGGSEEVLIGYKLKWWPASESILTANETVVFNRQTFGIVEGVQKGIVYALRVLGFNHGGDGKKSPTVYFTLEGQIVFNPQTTEVIGAGSRPTLILSLLFIPFLL